MWVAQPALSLLLLLLLLNSRAAATVGCVMTLSLATPFATPVKQEECQCSCQPQEAHHSSHYTSAANTR
jgi:hypothetical protein